MLVFQHHYVSLVKIKISFKFAYFINRLSFCISDQPVHHVGRRCIQRQQRAHHVASQWSCPRRVECCVMRWQRQDNRVRKWRWMVRVFARFTNLRLNSDWLVVNKPYTWLVGFDHAWCWCYLINDVFDSQNLNSRERF